MANFPAHLGGYVVVIDAAAIKEHSIFQSPIWKKIYKLLINYEIEYIPATCVYALTIKKDIDCNISDILDNINEIIIKER
jgi:hypothetical protein